MSEKVGKMQMGEGRGEPKGRRLMQCYRMREGDKSEANATRKLDTRSESRKELLTTMTRLTLEWLVRL